MTGNDWFLKLGDRVVNLENVTHVDLVTSATDVRSANMNYDHNAVRITFTDPSDYLDFFGAEAEALREFFAPGGPTEGRLGRTIDITPAAAET